MLAGYKTYITAGVTIVGAVAGYLVGDLTAAAAIQLGVTALLGAFIRHGITTEVNK